MRTTRLSELIQQGRLAVPAGGTVGAMSPAISAASQVQPHLSAAPVARSRPPVRDDIVDKIELLAIQLLSISRSSKSDPEALLREALLSIEECITAIGSRH